MKTITVQASKYYDVLIDTGLFSEISRYISPLCPSGKTAIISDSNVWPLYGETVCISLRNAGYEVHSFVFNAGESSKNGENYLQILNFLAQNAITRSDIIVALGGGVVGDLAGFCAATYLRGIPYIQVPTTLLAMVDSSVGGKTAIDLPTGKNLAGAFYQPSLVLCDVNVLSTLPETFFRDGCAEVIKYGVLYDSALFDHLMKYGPEFDREHVIARCVELKRNVVCEDEFDKGARQMLNLGHTIGHGIEAQSNYSISHGQAVAIGMAIVAKASVCHGICSMEVYEQIIRILDNFGLPTTTDFTSQQLYNSALSDKKRSGASLNVIVPVMIGQCAIRNTPIQNLKSFIEAGL